jgi:hypothetical protein
MKSEENIEKEVRTTEVIITKEVRNKIIEAVRKQDKYENIYRCYAMIIDKKTIDVFIAQQWKEDKKLEHEKEIIQYVEDLAKVLK